MKKLLFIFICLLLKLVFQAGTIIAAPSLPAISEMAYAGLTSQTITFTSSSTQSYGVANYTPATASSGLTVSLTSSNTAVATIVSNQIHIAGVGTTTITATQTGNATYSAASPVTQTLTVVAASQTISFAAIPTKTYGGAAFNPGATASSALTVTYTSSNTNVATVSGTTITIVGAGTSTITATQAGNTDYSAATPVSQLLTVNQEAQTITFGAIAAKTYGGAAFILTGTVSSHLHITYTSSNPSIATISDSTVTIVGAGTDTITASQPGNTNFLPATSVKEVLTVNQATQTIIFTAPATQTFGNAPFSLAATASSGLPVSFSSGTLTVATVSGSTATIVGAGSSVITASQAGNTNYKAATSVNQTLTVNKAAQTITFPTIPSLTFGGAAVTLTASSTSGLTITYVSSNSAIASVSGNTLTIVGSGTCTITAEQSGNANFNAATNVVQSITVAPEAQTITFPAVPTQAYGNPTVTLTASSTSGLVITYTSNNTAVATVSGSTLTIKGPGTCTITASQAGNSNYSAATSVIITLTVLQEAQTITFPAIATKTYGGAAFNPGATASSALTVTYTSSNTNVATVSGTTITIVGAGTSTITATQAGNTDYSAATPVSQLLTVNQEAQTITFGAIAAKTYGGAAFILTGTVSSHLHITYTSSNPSIATISDSTVTIVGAGTDTITASQPGNTNFLPATSVKEVLTVNQATQTIIFTAPATQTFGNAPFSLAATASSGLPVSFSSGTLTVATVSGSTATIVGAGSSVITASQAGNTNYKAATSVNQTLTVNKAAQTITFPTIPGLTFGGAAVTLTASSTSGLTITYVSSNSAIASVSGNTLTIVGSGTCTITAEQSGNANFNAATNVVQSITVAPEAQTITFPAVPTQAYGNPTVTLTASSTSGLVITYTSNNTAVATVSGSTLTIKGPGTCTITASQAGNSNYSAATSVIITLTVLQEAQTITFPAIATKTYGGAAFNPGATASSALTVTYTSSNTNVATVSGTTITIVGAGTSTITATQAGNTDYSAATPVSQLLTVNQEAQTITFGAIAAKTYGGAAFILTGTVSSHLHITYTSSNPSIATISDSTVTIAGAGTDTITASQPGNTNFLPATSVKEVLTVNKATQTISFTQPTTQINGNPPFSLVANASSGLPITFSSKTLTVATISGNTVTIVGPGSSVITAKQAGNANYKADSVTRTLVVLKTQTINFPNTFMYPTFGTADFSPGATASSGLTITYVSADSSIATIVNGNIHLVSVGVTTITAMQAGNSTYAPAANVSQQLTIYQGMQTINFAPIPNIYYGTANFNPGATATSGLPVYYVSDNPLVATVVDNLIHIVSVGNALITCTQGGNDNFMSAEDVTQLLTVVADTQEITFPALANQTYGNIDFSPNASSSSGLFITFTSSNPNVAIIVGNMIHIVGAGTTTITASQPGNTDYKAAVSISQVLTVAMENQAITFNPIASFSYSNVYLNPATINSSLPINYTSSDTSVAVIVNGLVHVVGGGTTTITASQPGNANFNPASSVIQPLTVTQANQSITFNALPSKNYLDTDFYAGAVSTSGLTITYISSNPNVASIVSGKIHITGAGTTIITAIQSGNATWFPATNVSQTLLVGQISQIITFSSFPVYSWGTPNITVSAVASSGLPVSLTSSNDSVATIIAGKIHIVGPGTSLITASQIGDSDYFSAPSVSQILNITKEVQTVTFNPLPSTVYNGPDIQLSATASSGLPVTYVSDNTNVAIIVGTSIQVISAGTANITAMQAGNEYYAAASNVSNILVVNNTSQNITFTPIPEKTFGDSDFIVSATASSNLPVTIVSTNNAIATVSNGIVHIIHAGTDTLIASQSGNTNFQAAVSVPVQLVVLKNGQSISFSALPVEVYGSPSFTLSATGGGSGNPIVFISSDTLVATVNGTLVTINGAGSTTISAHQTGNNDYLPATSVMQNLEVSKESNSITFNAMNNETYLDTDFNPGAYASSGLPVTYTSTNLSVAIIISGKIHITGAGTATIIASQSGNSNYSAAQNISMPLLVNKASQIISFTPMIPATYGQANINPNAVASSGLPVSYSSSDSLVATIVNGTIHIIGGGNCVITAFQNGNSNYLPAGTVQQVLTVNGEFQSINFPPISNKIYGSNLFSPDATASSGLPVSYTSSDNSIVMVFATPSGPVIQITGTGTVTITASQEGNNEYLPANTASQSFTVDKSNQTIAYASIPPMTYGDADIEPTFYATSGLPVILSSSNSLVAIILDGKIHIIGAGQTNITASQPGNSNYNPASNVTIELLVNKADQVLIFPTPASEQYGDADFNPGAIASSNLPVTYTSSNTNVAEIINGLVHIIGVGTTTITATQSGNVDYTSAGNPQSQTLVIEPATLTVTADDFTRDYGLPNPQFTVWYQGFVNGDDYTVLTQQPVTTTAAIITSPMGQYPIVPSGGVASNYTFVYVDGTLTIDASIPTQPPLPIGPTILCIDPDDQVYQISDNSSASSYIWSLNPSSAGTVSGTGQQIDIQFNKTFTGIAGLSVQGTNPSGTGSSSDTLYINVIALPNKLNVIYNKSYCSSNIYSDSIELLNSQNGYIYQLLNNGIAEGSSLSGTNSTVTWNNLQYGNYSIEELNCKILVADSMTITEINGIASVPQLVVKWNDVIMCSNLADSIVKYQWYQNGEPMAGQTNQNLWTQQIQGVYSVQITDLNGCQAMSDTVLITTNGATVYPNPNNGQFTVDFSSSETGNVIIYIYNLNSTLLEYKTFTKAATEFQQPVTLSGIQPGVYFIDVTMNNQVVLYQKLIIN